MLIKKINAIIKFSIVDLLYKISIPTWYYHFQRKTLVFLIKEMLMKKINATIKFSIVDLLYKISTPTWYYHKQIKMLVFLIKEMLVKKNKCHHQIQHSRFTLKNTSTDVASFCFDQKRSILIKNVLIKNINTSIRVPLSGSHFYKFRVPLIGSHFYKFRVPPIGSRVPGPTFTICPWNLDLLAVGRVTVEWIFYLKFLNNEDERYETLSKASWDV